MCSRTLWQAGIPELSPLPQICQMGSGNTGSTPTASTGGGFKPTLQIPDMAADIAVTLGAPAKAGQAGGAGSGNVSYPGNSPVCKAIHSRSAGLASSVLLARVFSHVLQLLVPFYAAVLHGDVIHHPTVALSSIPCGIPGQRRLSVADRTMARFLTTLTPATTVQAGDGVALSMDALLGTTPGADDADPLGLDLPNMGLQPLTMSAPGVQQGSPLSPIVALHNGVHTPSPFVMPQVRLLSRPSR